jgi:NADH pyrophosphatase NudC (nudix superfamily)
MITSLATRGLNIKNLYNRYNRIMDEFSENKNEIVTQTHSNLDVTKDTQECPVCGEQMGIMPGSRDAYCKNCGYKDPCCE